MGSHPDDRVQPEVIDCNLYWYMATLVMSMDGITIPNSDFAPYLHKSSTQQETKDGN